MQTKDVHIPFLILITRNLNTIYVQLQTIQALGPISTSIFTVGIILVAIGSIFDLFHPLNFATCNIIYYLYSLGVVLAVSSSLLKSYRIAMIYFYSIKKLKNVVISNRKLFKYLFVTFVFEFSLCIAYTLFSDLGGNMTEKYNDSTLQIEYHCNDSRIVTLINHINFMFNLTLLAIFCYFAVRTRIASKIYKEPNCAYFGSFFTLFSFCIVGIFHLVSNDLEILITIESGATAIVLIVIWSLFYGMRMYRFYSYPNDRNTVTILNSKMFEMNITVSTDKSKTSVVAPTYSTRHLATKPSISPARSVDSVNTSDGGDHHGSVGDQKKGYTLANIQSVSPSHTMMVNPEPVTPVAVPKKTQQRDIAIDSDHDAGQVVETMPKLNMQLGSQSTDVDTDSEDPEKGKLAPTIKIRY